MGEHNAHSRASQRDISIAPGTDTPVWWQNTDAERLRTHYSQYGEIIDSVVMTDKNTGRPRGFGFVT